MKKLILLSMGLIFLNPIFAMKNESGVFNGYASGLGSSNIEAPKTLIYRESKSHTDNLFKKFFYYSNARKFGNLVMTGSVIAVGAYGLYELIIKANLKRSMKIFGLAGGLELTRRGGLLVAHRKIGTIYQDVQRINKTIGLGQVETSTEWADRYRKNWYNLNREPNCLMLGCQKELEAIESCWGF